MKSTLGILMKLNQQNDVGGTSMLVNDRGDVGGIG